MTRLTVNERPVHFLMDGDTPLLSALRDAANLTGTKYGCGNGDCGACTVIIDGEGIRSCLVTLAEVEGRFVTTIEALSGDRSHPLQQAMMAEGAVQCGFCTPGFVMAGAALLARNPGANREEIAAAIPNLCPCGAAPRIVRAIERAGRAMRGRERLDSLPVPGLDPALAARDVPALEGEPAPPPKPVTTTPAND
jgi:aerobic-type carbon monoxide dehydrogenase small subunit (CoxS/CutS family)